MIRYYVFRKPRATIAFILVFILLSIIPTLVNAMKMDYKNIAFTETKIWQSYYKKDADSLLKNMEAFIGEQYGVINAETAKNIAERFVSAYLKFSTIPINTAPEQYNITVLPLVITAYQTLRQSINASWDPQKAAVADLSWWIARRQNNTFNPEIVSQKMVVLFYTLYGQKNNYHFERAAYLRSTAGRYRDQCQDVWGGINAEDWKVVNSLLENSYDELYLGITEEKQAS
jgi:hypothetical protein